MAEHPDQKTIGANVTNLHLDQPGYQLNAKLQSLLLAAEQRWQLEKDWDEWRAAHKKTPAIKKETTDTQRQDTQVKTAWIARKRLEGIVPTALDPWSPLTSNRDALPHYRILMEWQQSRLLHFVRKPADKFLDFIDPIGNGTSADIRSAWQNYQSRGISALCALQALPSRQSEAVKPLFDAYAYFQDDYFRFKREKELWDLQHELVRIDSVIGQHVSRYGFTEYRAMRAAILNDAVR